MGLLALIFVKLSRILFLAFAVTTVVSFAFATFAESVASDEPGLAADTQPPAPLTGPWQVIRGKIARPGEFSRMYKGDTTPLPDPWHRRKKADQSNSEPLGFGVASYRLKLKLPKHARPLAVNLQHPYSAHEFWINGELAGSNGRITETPEGFEAFYLQRIFALPETEEVELVLIVANFEHFAGGVLRPLLIGSEAAMQSKVRTFYFSYVFVFGALLALLVFQLAYFIRSLGGPPEWAHFWYCALSIVLLVRLFTVQAIPYFLDPDLPQISTKLIEYQTLYLAPLTYVAFMSSMFPREFPKIVCWPLYGLSLAMTGLATVAPVHVYTSFQDFWIFVMLAVIIYAQGALVMAWIRKQHGAAAVVICTVLFFITLLNDSAAYLHTFDLKPWSLPDLTPFGIAILSAGFAIALGSRTRAVYDQARKLSSDLEALTGSLEQQVADRTADLEHARAEAEKTAREKSNFLATASHDLRQPIHALSVFNQSLLYQVEHEAGLKEIAGKQAQLVRSLSGMLETMLDLSRLEAGTVEPRFEGVSLGDLFREVRYAVEAQALRGGVALKFVDTTLAVRADRRLLRRILVNLVVNAVNAAPDGKVVVGARRQGNLVRLCVADNGHGIPLNERERIFEQFVQLRQDGASSPSGLGLGLSIVADLCRLMDFRIGLNSEPGRGTTFAITAPIAAPDLPAESEGEDTPLVRREPEPQRLVILVVDNEPAVLDAMVALLRGWGHAAMGAASALETIRELDELGKPDLILCDYQLDGGATGFELIAQVRQYFHTDIPAAIITGATRPDDLRILFRSGFPVLHKPLDFDHMNRLLARVSSPQELV